MEDTPMRCLVVVCGDPEPTVAATEGCFASWFVRGFGAAAEVTVVDPRKAPLAREAMGSLDALILTGSPHSVYEPLPWIDPLQSWLRAEVGERAVPTLGVCFGHQLLAQTFGGTVVKNPRGREMGTIDVARHPHAEAAPLFAGLPGRFRAQATHCDTVLRAPPGAEVLAESSLDGCQAFRFKNAWGVQFHPEVTAPILRGYVRARAPQLRAEGTDPDHLHDRIEDTPAGPRVLANFLRWARAVRAA